MVECGLLQVRGLDLSSWMSCNVFRFPVLFFVWDCKDTVRCWRTGAASCRAAATELFGRKNLEKNTLAGPCFRVPKSASRKPATFEGTSRVEDSWLCERQLRLPEDAVLKNHRCILGARPCSDIAKKTL